MIQLRPYQLDLMERTRARMRARVRRIIIQAPTGSGKTALTAAFLGAASQKGSLSWFGVHRAELLQQSEAAFRLAGVRHGIIAAGYSEDPNAPVQICSIPTLAKRLGRYRKPDLIVLDEAHHCPSSTWSKIIEANPQAFVIGLTATPCRLDGKGLGTLFDEILLGPSVADLIEQGYLADYEVYAPQLADASKLHTRGGDYSAEEASALMDKPSITGDAVSHYKRLCYGKPAIVFATSIKHSKAVAEQFRQQNVPALHVDGETERDERLRAMRSFRDGEIKVLTNCGLFSEGVDVPSLHAVILLRPTKSLSLFMQACGRALRPSPGKSKALIIDHVGAVRYHGLPDDPHEWSLDGVDKGKKKDAAIGVKTCPDCFRAVRSVVKVCPCGHSFVPKEREIAHVDGELQKVDKERARKAARQEQGMAGDLDSLIAIGRARGYPKPEAWARIVFAARKQKRGRATVGF